ncbi:hypothetical protein [Acidocella sp. MX-AZ02]|uniref:hypothetical protein n=1 Tax=Acidocella sp. MX-AZ02 TaxID=1214225 RepID=UPI001969B82F|nr:hypothetical protein [Acidocella sp. MX-AZ02]
MKISRVFTNQQAVSSVKLRTGARQSIPSSSMDNCAIEVAVEDGDPVPKPSTIETVRGNSDFGGWIISEVDLGI